MIKYHVVWFIELRRHFKLKCWKLFSNIEGEKIIFLLDFSNVFFYKIRKILSSSTWLVSSFREKSRMQINFRVYSSSFEIIEQVSQQTYVQSIFIKHIQHFPASWRRNFTMYHILFRDPSNLNVNSPNMKNVQPDSTRKLQLHLSVFRVVKEENVKVEERGTKFRREDPRKCK